MDDSRTVDPSFAKLFNINSIKYPTGGRTDFDFEANTFDLFNSGTSLVDEGVVVQGFQSKSYNGNIYNQYQPLPADLPYKLMDLTDMAIIPGNAGSPVTMSVFFLYSGPPRSICTEASMPFNNLTVTLCKEDGTPVTGDINPNYSSNTTCAGSPGNYVGINFQATYTNLTPGKYYLKVYIDASVNYISTISVGLSYNAYQRPVINSLNGSTLSNALYGGGLRIRKITDFDQLGNKTNVKKFDYIFTDDYGKLRSSGRRMLKPDYSYFEQAIIYGCPGGGFIYKLMRASDSYLPLTAYSGNLVGYDKVTVYYGENGDNGKSEYTYSNAAGNALTYIDGATPLNGIFPTATGVNFEIDIYEPPVSGPKPKTPLFAILPVTDNGNLLKVIDYKFTGGNYQIIKAEENVYTNLLAGQDIYWWAVQQTPRKFSTIEGQVISVPARGLASYRKNYPALVATRNELTTKTTTIYDQTDNTKLSTTVQNFLYDNTTHLQLLKQEIYNSKNQLLKTEYKYPYDFASPLGSTPNIYNTMLNRNMLTPVIEQKNFNGTSFLQSSKTNYFDWGNNILKPQTIDIQKGSAAIETMLRYNAYDAKGNPLSVSKENDVKLAYVWDYTSTYPIAEVNNVAQSDIAFTSFEADGKGNWVYTGTPEADAKAPTGKLVYTLNGSNSMTKTGLNTATIYIVSYWAKNAAALSIAGTIAGYPISGRALNGWTYYEHKITGQNTINISGNGSIDELRLYPEKALMTTYTYMPLIGITSQCDANNRITYYEYDAFNRLILIRDQDNNILKKICYNYAGQPENCQTLVTYTNTAASQVFTRNNCGGCDAGSQVTYSVPAGIYSSTASQAAADQLAQDDIAANGQQYANTNGSCTPTGNVAITYINNFVGAGFTAIYTSSSGTYTFSVPASGSGVLGCVPAGTYTINISKPGNTNPILFNVGCATFSGTSANFKFRNVSSTSCNVLNLSYGD
jgi:YD repeat-containing protein